MCVCVCVYFTAQTSTHATRLSQWLLDWALSYWLVRVMLGERARGRRGGEGGRRGRSRVRGGGEGVSSGKRRGRGRSTAHHLEREETPTGSDSMHTGDHTCTTAIMSMKLSILYIIIIFDSKSLNLHIHIHVYVITCT